MIAIASLKEVVAPLWISDLSITEPSASPLFGSLENLSPVLLMLGTSDMLCVNVRRLSARFQHANKDGSEGVKESVEMERFKYVEEEEMIHVCPLWPCWQGERARKGIVKWVRKKMGAK
jgi:acetyl esterase/lipase